MCRMLGLKNFEYARHKEILEDFLALADTGNVLPGSKPGHHDGWGIGYYENGRAVVHKSGGSAAEEKEDFRKTCARIDRTKVLLVHLRKSSWKGTSIADHAHPFSHENFLFAHNGTIEDYKTLLMKFTGRDQPRPDARDTEVYFRYVMKFASLGAAKALKKAVQHIKKYNSYTSLSCLFSDGRNLYGYREYSHHPEYYSLYHASFGEAALISSQPLCSRLKWKMLRRGILFVF